MYLQKLTGYMLVLSKCTGCALKEPSLRLHPLWCRVLIYCHVSC